MAGAGVLGPCGVGWSGFRRVSFGCSPRMLGGWPGVARWQPPKVANRAGLAATVVTLRGPEVSFRVQAVGPEGRGARLALRRSPTQSGGRGRIGVADSLPPVAAASAGPVFGPRLGTEWLVLCAISGRPRSEALGAAKCLVRDSTGYNRGCVWYNVGCDEQNEEAAAASYRLQRWLA